MNETSSHPTCKEMKEIHFFPCLGLCTHQQILDLLWVSTVELHRYHSDPQRLQWPQRRLLATQCLCSSTVVYQKATRSLTKDLYSSTQFIHSHHRQLVAHWQLTHSHYISVYLTPSQLQLAQNQVNNYNLNIVL